MHVGRHVHSPCAYGTSILGTESGNGGGHGRGGIPSNLSCSSPPDKNSITTYLEEGGRGGWRGACVEYKDAAIKDRRSLLRQCGCRVSAQARMRVQWYSQIFSRSEDRVYLNNVWMVKLLHQLNLSTGGTHTVAHHY